MVPLAEVIVFTLVGLLLFLVARRWPRFVSLRVAIFVFAFLGFLSLLLMVPRLHRLAVLVLAAGLATQTARIIGAHPAPFYALVRRTLGWLVIFARHGQQNGRREGAHGAGSLRNALMTRRQFLLSTGTTVAGLAVGVHGWQELAERRALGQVPPASPGRPERAADRPWTPSGPKALACMAMPGPPRRRWSAGPNGAWCSSARCPQRPGRCRRTPACSPAAGPMSCLPTGKRRSMPPTPPWPRS